MTKSSLLIPIFLLITLLTCSCNKTVIGDTLDSRIDDSAQTELSSNEDAQTSSDTLKTIDIDDIRSEYYIDERNGKFECTLDDQSLPQLKLPNSKGKANIIVNEDAVDHLALIDHDLFQAAIITLFKEVKKSDGIATSYPFISIDIKDNYVTMYLEWIVLYDPPHTQVYVDGKVVTKGCGCDHDHIQIWDTRISHSTIK